MEGCSIPSDFYIPSTTNINSKSGLSAIQQVTPKTSDFSEAVARANHELVKGYKCLQNEF